MVVSRDNGWNEREYGRDKWPPLLRKAKDLIAGGERSLSRVVRQVYREMTLPISHQQDLYTVLGKPVMLPRSFAWAGSNGYFADLVIDACGSGTGTVIELGSGWGRCIFDVWLRGGPRKASYYGLEMTANGRACADLIASLEPELEFRSAPFDFNDPDYSRIEKRPGRTVVFTDFSVCVIPHLRKEVFTKLRDLSDDIVGVMIEPFGWQIPATDRDMTRQGSSLDYAVLHDYNRDLWGTLKDLERDGVLSIDFVETEVVGLKPENSMSVVRWKMAG